MKKYRVFGHTKIVCSMVVKAESEEDAIQKANETYGELTNYVGNGGMDKLLGPVGTDQDQSLYPDSEIVFDDVMEE